MTDDNEINRIKLFDSLEFGGYVVVNYAFQGYFILNLLEESEYKKKEVSKLEREVID